MDNEETSMEGIRPARPVTAKKKAVAKKPAKKTAPTKAKVDDDDDTPVVDEEEAERIRMRESLETLKTEKKVKIMIHSTEVDKSDAKVGVNGHVYQIPRDVECEVPESVAHAIENAKIIHYRQQKRSDGEDGMETIPVEVPRFPFSIRR